MGNHMCKAHDFAPTLRNKEASNCEPCWFKKTHTDSTPWVGLSVVELFGWEAIPAQAMTCKRSYPTNPSSTLFLSKSLRVGANNCIVWSSLDMPQLRPQTNQPSVTNLETWQRNSAAHNFTGEFLILVVLDSEMLRTPWCSQHSNAQISWSQPAVMLGCIRYCWRRRTDLGASEIQVDIYRS